MIRPPQMKGIKGSVAFKGSEARSAQPHYWHRVEDPRPEKRRLHGGMVISFRFDRLFVNPCQHLRFIMIFGDCNSKRRARYGFPIADKILEEEIRPEPVLMF